MKGLEGKINYQLKNHYLTWKNIKTLINTKIKLKVLVFNYFCLILHVHIFNNCNLGAILGVVIDNSEPKALEMQKQNEFDKMVENAKNFNDKVNKESKK